MQPDKMRTTTATTLMRLCLAGVRMHMFVCVCAVGVGIVCVCEGVSWDRKAASCSVLFAI